MQQLSPPPSPSDDEYRIERPVSPEPRERPPQAIMQLYDSEVRREIELLETQALYTQELPLTSWQRLRELYFVGFEKDILHHTRSEIHQCSCVFGCNQIATSAHNTWYETTHWCDECTAERCRCHCGTCERARSLAEQDARA